VYKLTKTHIQSYGNKPILLSSDGCAGPFHQSSILAHTDNSTAADFVMRHWTGEVRATDPPLEVDDGADFETFCREYVGVRASPENVSYYKLVKKGKLPEPA
jgi:hypothetical protein